MEEPKLKWHLKPSIDLGKGWIEFLPNESHCQIKNNDKWGLIDYNGNLIVDTISDFSLIKESLIPFKNEYGKIGLMDKDRNEKFPAMASGVKYIEPNFYALKLPGEEILVNSKGRIIKTKYKIRSFNTQSFKENVIGVEVWLGNQQGTASGYIDTTGKSITKFKYCYNGVFSNNIASVTELDYKTKYYIDKKENIIFRCPENWVVAKSFEGDLAMIQVENKGIGFINRDFQIVVEPQYNSYGFKEGFYYVSKNNKPGVLNSDGDVVVPFEFDRVTRLNDSLFIVGKVFFKKKYNNLHKLWSFENTYYKYALYNTFQKRLVLGYDYEELKKASLNILIAKIGDHYRYIDTKGVSLTKLQFEKANPFYENKAWVKFNNLWGIIQID